MTVAKNLAELQDQIRSRYGELSKRLQQVAKYLTFDPDPVRQYLWFQWLQ